MDPKFIFVTGGVVSSLGKGITAASLGRLLKCRGLRGYAFRSLILYQRRPRNHESISTAVFVTDDGAETTWIWATMGASSMKTLPR